MPSAHAPRARGGGGRTGGVAPRGAARQRRDVPRADVGLDALEAAGQRRVVRDEDGQEDPRHEDGEAHGGADRADALVDAEVGTDPHCQ